MTNICIDARVLQKSHWQGEQVYVYNILTELAALGSQDTFHLYFGWRGWNERLDMLMSQPNMIYHAHPGWRSHAWLPLSLLRSKSRIYYRMYNETSPMAIRVLCPTAILVHDNGHFFLPEAYGVTDVAQLRLSRQRHISAFDRIFTVSKTVKNELIELFGLEPSRIVVAPNAASLPDPVAPEAKPPTLPAERPFFVMINPGGANKNWRLALAAFSVYVQLHPEGAEMRLALAGNLRHEKDAIHQVIESDPALRDRVLCLGYVSDEQLRYLYRHARAAIIPSHYEGFNRPILEAMAYHLPVVVSDIPIHREVACDAALYTPLHQPEALAEALAHLHTDKGLRTSLVAKGRLRLNQYSWQQSAQATLDGLHAML